MDTYIEKLEELDKRDVNVYSLIQGMTMYRAEVRDSGIAIWRRDKHDQGRPLDQDTEKYKELKAALIAEIYKEK